MDTFRFRGKHWGDGANRNFMVPTNLVHIVIGPEGAGKIDKKEKSLKNRKIQYPKRFCDEKHFGGKKSGSAFENVFVVPMGI